MKASSCCEAPASLVCERHCWKATVCVDGLLEGHMQQSQRLLLFCARSIWPSCGKELDYRSGKSRGWCGQQRRDDCEVSVQPSRASRSPHAILALSNVGKIRPTICCGLLFERHLQLYALHSIQACAGKVSIFFCSELGGAVLPLAASFVQRSGSLFNLHKLARMATHAVAERRFSDCKLLVRALHRVVTPSPDSPPADWQFERCCSVGSL